MALVDEDEGGFVGLTSIDTGNSNVTNSGGFHDVTDDKLLDCLVLRHAACTIGATNSLHVSTVVLAASSITTFLGLIKNNKQN